MLRHRSIGGTRSAAQHGIGARGPQHSIGGARSAAQHWGRETCSTALGARGPQHASVSTNTRTSGQPGTPLKTEHACEPLWAPRQRCRSKMVLGSCSSGTEGARANSARACSSCATCLSSSATCAFISVLERSAGQQTALRRLGPGMRQCTDQQVQTYSAMVVLRSPPLRSALPQRRQHPHWLRPGCGHVRYCRSETLQSCLPWPLPCPRRAARFATLAAHMTPGAWAHCCCCRLAPQ